VRCSFSINQAASNLPALLIELCIEQSYAWGAHEVSARLGLNKNVRLMLNILKELAKFICL
jgi:hypothetical protein